MPHGGTLIDLFGEVDISAADKTIELTDRQSCDTQLLCNGGFSPLTGFMNEDDYTSVVSDMKTTSGVMFGAFRPRGPEQHKSPWWCWGSRAMRQTKSLSPSRVLSPQASRS